ncbi:hypothetical protein [Brachyspira sp. SAP_772]|uniref:hypothetical protein n=1 Tax=Brachyspira sp. SAP_772 TaxID=2608385 RepID=UPI0012F50597|nr:hypothetical protein [Brachyspira sp. SAP_772]
MEKNKIYFLILLLTIVSCKKNNIEKGILYSTGYSDLSYEASKTKAIENMYYYIAEKTALSINRSDYNVVGVFLKDSNIIDFNNKEITKIKNYKKNDNYYTDIKVEDASIYTNSLQALSKIVREGKIEGNIFRANASIQLTENAKLSPYTRQILTQNALKRAYESLYYMLLKEGIDVNEVVKLTNNAYISEESYSENEYNVVIETEIN